MSRPDPWRQFRHDLDSAENTLRGIEYSSIFGRASHPDRLWYRPHDLREGTLAHDEVGDILSAAALGPPHGLDLLIPFAIPDLPSPPNVPSFGPVQQWLLDRHEKLRRDIAQKQAAINAKYLDDRRRGDEFASAYRRGDPAAISLLALTTLARHRLPRVLSMWADFAVDTPARVGLCSIAVPDFVRLPIVKQRGSSVTAPWQPVSATEKKRLSEQLLYCLCIRAAYLVAHSDPGEHFDIVAVNAHQKWFDPATGAPREGIVASMQATKADLLTLQPGRVDAKACFRHLRGVSTPSIEAVAVVKPIFMLDVEDNRVVAGREVAADLDADANLAAMPWDDFEHLIRQLFEWEFGRNGVAVKVTRASRDRGVDAIMFDPDPFRGGKYVLQAKRYTSTVDVAAVRDLYGTVINEGANRGILVTTSRFGPDAYEFAKDKPISLVDGPNLLVMLERHGRRYKIDLAEAREQRPQR